MNNKLKNPVWFSLNETHKNFTIDYDVVKFYNPEVCPFGAFTEGSDTKNALNEYAKLTDSFFLVSENGIPDFDKNFITLEKKMEGCQMVFDKMPSIEITENIVELSEKHIDEIYNLVWLVMPGYYKKRSFEMGNYYGIFKDNKLVSITGQRMQTNDFIEISAVVTHPEHRRKGYAKQLTLHVTKEIIKENKHPILHTNKGNHTIKMYEKLGYKLTRDMNWWLFSKK
jgi:ribosomal protein S18 acetylase RimI-like enzyme